MSLVGSYHRSVGEIRVAVEDPLGIVDPPLEFNFTIKLTGLSEGNHHVDLAAFGLVRDGESDVSVGKIHDHTTYFTVTDESPAFPTTPTPSPNPTSTPTLSPEPTSTPYNEPQPSDQPVILGSAVTATVLVAGLGLLIYFIKRK